MMDALLEFENIMEHIVASIRSAGYEPYDQLYGYLKTGDETYITRTGVPEDGSRSWIVSNYVGM